MSAKVLIEVEAQHEATVRRVVALAEELEQLALTAPAGAVFDACEGAVIVKGRDLQTQMLAEAVARRVAAAEKKGRRCASAPAAGGRRIVAPNPGSSSAPSASSP